MIQESGFTTVACWLEHDAVGRAYLLSTPLVEGTAKRQMGVAGPF